ncbi:unnamed protein product [Diatraea saccharalis]|uniref:Vitellogenin n=1 Tax=Diatraea saccharalis TaxID=40085 RepID=A0A9N9RGB1_9NEOP|nr:unnamed protein product [Diatraea saccharalis]
MKILLLAAFIAAVASGQLNQFVSDNQSHQPWQVGKLYRYEVDSFTLARLPEGASTGTAFKAHFVIRVPAPGLLLARLENPSHAQIHQELPSERQLPSDIKYQPLEKRELTFGINVEGGRVLALTIPTSLPLAHENLLKGLISALQLDLSNHRHVRSSYDGFEKESQQGAFKKMETDVTGDCETLYNVYPAVPEWRRELPKFANEEEPIMVSKTKNYGHCHHRVAYHFGVPEGAEWTGTAHGKDEEQFIRRATVTRMLVGKQGPIYKSETTSTVHVNPQLYGKDKAEVISYVKLYLDSYEQDSETEWPLPENKRIVNNLLYSVSQKKQIIISESSSSSESSESIENFSQTMNGMRMSSNNRVRRSAHTPKIISINKVIVKRSSDDSSSSSSSSSDSTSAYQNDEVPRDNEPAYAALYMMPQVRADKKQNPLNAQKLVQDMAQQLQNPNNMPKSDFLTKFNILVKVLASMSYEQLSLTSRTIEVTRLSNNQMKADMWMIYRDAVTQVGNMPAFQQIKSWIQNKKIQEEEAAEIVASLAQAIRYPTKDIMMQFFRLAVSNEVKEQPYLNTTALIACTRLINMGQVDNNTAHSFYPTHMYGRLTPQHDAFVVEEVIPYLSKVLKESIQYGDSGKALVYIHAIGNLGHHSILDVFAPYIQGEIRVTTYLRSQMVRNLRVLAHERHSHCRAALFNIVKNVAEPYEVRVAAIENIFMAHPSSAMMQAMAQMTHNDPSVQIRAILKSSILSAADLKHPLNMDLARTAQSAKWMVTKQEYGNHYSGKFLNDYNDKTHEFGYMTAFSYTGSEDSFWPKSFKYSVKNKAKENTVSASISDIQQLMHVFQHEIDRMVRKNPKSEAHHKYSAEKVAEMLNIKRDPKKPLEASVLIDIMGQERLFTYSENELEQIPAIIAKYMSTLAKGSEKHYTKVLNKAQVSIMFPMCTGMPFVYKYKEPTVVHTYGKVKVEVNPSKKEGEDVANIMKEIFFTFARNIDGSVGFIDTLVNQYPRVGVVSKIQVHLPLKLQVQAQYGQLKIILDSLRPDQDNTLMHYSVWPYSTCQKKDSLVTVAQDPNTKVISRSKKVVSTDSKVGQWIGYNFQIQGYSYSSDYKNIGHMLQSRDLFTNIVHLLHQRDVALTHFNLKHLVKQSQNKRVVFTVAYDIYYNPPLEATNQQPLVAMHTEDMTPNSKDRRQQMATRVCAGIKTAKAHVVDVSAIFEGEQKQQFIMTAAIGDSHIDSKIQYAFFAGRSDQTGKSSNQINAVGTVFKPTVSPLNFLEAIKKEMKMKFEFNVKYGQNSNGNVRVDGYMERSKKYTEELLNHPLGKKCAQQMETDNLYQHACHKMTVKAHSPDYLRASVVYKDVSPAFRNMTYKAFRIVDNLGFWYTDVNPMKTTPDGKLEIESHFWYPDNSMNLALSTRLGEVHYNNVPIPKVTDSWLAVYTPFNPQERVLNELTEDQYQPFCSVDANEIKTFSNRTYEYILSRNWHVVMQDDSTLHGGNDKVVVLARRPQDKKLELYISYKTRNGKDIELEVQPSSEEPNKKHILKVNTNAKELFDNDLVMYLDEANFDVVLKYYTLPDGVLIINILQNYLRLMYDGTRLVVLAKGHRNHINGICGRMSGDKRDDYLTPQGLVDRPEHFGASFALKEANSDPKTLELQAQAQKVAYPTKHEYTVILPRDNEWRSLETSLDSSNYHNLYRTRGWQKRGQCQVHQQIQYYEDHSHICITLTPLPACPSNCRIHMYKVQAAQVVCRPIFDKEFQMYKEQIRQGHNPKVLEVPEQQPKQFQVPTSCNA